MRHMLWQKGEMIDLGALLGPQSTPAAINDRGTMVGWLVPTNGTADKGQPFVWENGVVRQLNLASRKGHPNAINNSGRVVGYAEKSANRYACLWNGDELLDLNDLLETKSGWHLVSAAAINDRGQILVSAVKGRQHRDCLLSASNLSPLLEDEAAVAAAPPRSQGTAIAPFNLTLFDRLPNGAFRLAFAGTPGGKYYVEASTNLVVWERLGPANNNDGKVEFTDTNAVKFTLRFYRAVLAP
jgi:probable HAF family extracellular repeat protein